MRLRVVGLLKDDWTKRKSDGRLEKDGGRTAGKLQVELKETCAAADELHKVVCCNRLSEEGLGWDLFVVLVWRLRADVVGGDRAKRGPINTHPILGKYSGQQIYSKCLAVVHQTETYDEHDSCRKSGSGGVLAFTHFSSTRRLLSRNR